MATISLEKSHVDSPVATPQLAMVDYMDNGILERTLSDVQQYLLVARTPSFQSHISRDILASQRT